jgi:hypothetical protein
VGLESLTHGNGIEVNGAPESEEHVEIGLGSDHCRVAGDMSNVRRYSVISDGRDDECAGVHNHVAVLM